MKTRRYTATVSNLY